MNDGYLALQLHISCLICIIIDCGFNHVSLIILVLIWSGWQRVMICYSHASLLLTASFNIVSS